MTRKCGNAAKWNSCLSGVIYLWEIKQDMILIFLGIGAGGVLEVVIMTHYDTEIQKWQ